MCTAETMKTFGKVLNALYELEHADAVSRFQHTGMSTPRAFDKIYLTCLCTVILKKNRFHLLDILRQSPTIYGVDVTRCQFIWWGVSCQDGRELVRSSCSLGLNVWW